MNVTLHLSRREFSKALATGTAALAAIGRTGRAADRQPGSIEIRQIVAATEDRPRHDSATVVELKDGRLLIAWMEYVGGKLKGEDHGRCNIAAMTSSDRGRTWDNYRVLVEQDPADTNIHFPSFLRLKNGNILFYYLIRNYLAPGEQAKSSGMICVSSDEGETFSAPIRHETLSALGGNGRILSRLSSGRIVLPAQRYQHGVWGGPLDHQVAGCYFSDDEGESWQPSQTWVDLTMRGAMEPHVVELAGGRLLMTLRTQLGAVFAATSDDGGMHWSTAQTTGLKSPESMPCLTRIPTTGDLLLIWNDSPYDPHYDHYGKRTPLTSAISRDGGTTWVNFKNFETDPLYEFTNPTCYYLSDNKVLIAYVASLMDDPNPPGHFGRQRMPLKAAIADIDWFYS